MGAQVALHRSAPRLTPGTLGLVGALLRGDEMPFDCDVTCVLARTFRILVMEKITMRRVLVPALLAIALVACSNVDVQAGLFSKLCGGGGCAAEPSCGCEVAGCADGCGYVEPSCGLEAAPCGGGCLGGCGMAAPSCGCEVAPSCGCDVAPSCGAPKRGLLAKLFGGCGGGGSDCGCSAEPTCGVEVMGCGGCAGDCGIAAPSCGCEVAAPCGCDSGCGPAPKKCGLLGKIFGKRGGGCGCAAEPTCGVEVMGCGGGCAGGCGMIAEPTCGVEAPCGCAN